MVISPSARYARSPAAYVPDDEDDAGRITLNEKDSMKVAVQADGSLTASFKADRDGSYRVELMAPTGEIVVASHAVHDRRARRRAPSVSFNRPRRDTSVFVDGRYSSRRQLKTISAFGTSTSCIR